MKRSLVLTFAALLGASAALPAMAANDDLGRVFAILPQSRSGQHGTVALKPRGGKTVVEIHLLNAPAAGEPAQIHRGSCSQLDAAPQYKLKPVVNGISETTLSAPLSELLGGALTVNVHRENANLSTYVACATLAS